MLSSNLITQSFENLNAMSRVKIYFPHNLFEVHDFVNYDYPTDNGSFSIVDLDFKCMCI